VRDAAAKILDNTTLADLMNKPSAGPKRKGDKKKKREASVLPMVMLAGGKEGHD
jgi:DNA-binding IscR family transcriptional regulator